MENNKMIERFSIVKVNEMWHTLKRNNKRFVMPMRY